MNLQFDISLIKDYESPSQIARILTEKWVRKKYFLPKLRSSHSTI